MSESTNKTNILEILISPFVIILNIIKYTWVGLKYVGFDLWVDLYNSASYKVDRTYQTTNVCTVRNTAQGRRHLSCGLPVCLHNRGRM